MNIEELKEENNLYDINIQNDKEGLMISMIFMWNEDYGVFSKTKRSDLTILTPKIVWEKIQLDLDNHKGIVYDYIKNHKSYVGKLLNFYKEGYEVNYGD